MKKIITMKNNTKFGILLASLMVSGISFAQIGINTQNPQGAFNIDGAKDNPASGAPNAAQQANDFVMTSTGSIGVGTTVPTSKLEVNGSSTNSVAYDAGAGTAINYSLSNLAYTTANAGAFTLSNIKNGGTYTLSVRGTTSGTATFTASGFTVKYVNNRATIAGKETLFTFIVMGTTVYVYTATGF